MIEESAFSADEHEQRLDRLREELARRDLAAALLTSPETIYYYSGLNRMGYFAFTALLVSAGGDRPLLFARAMEEATVSAQVKVADFAGYAETEQPGTLLLSALDARRFRGERVGVEMAGMSWPLGVWNQLTQLDIGWADCARLVAETMSVKSSAELEHMHQAAQASSAALAAASEATLVGATDTEIAAVIYDALLDSGSADPGFAPLVRTLRRLHYEHRSWSDDPLGPDDGLIVELSGCVQRYHAPLTRTLYPYEPGDLQDPRAGTDVAEAAQVADAAVEAARDALRPGATLADAFAAWREVVVDDAGWDARHNCGHLVGVGFAPGWFGGPAIIGIDADEQMPVREGMTPHLFAWLTHPGRSSYVVSDTYVVESETTRRLT